MKSAIPGQQCPVSNRLSKSELFGLLPPVWPEDLLPQMRQAVARSKRKIVVLDDDPTGTQTVHGVPVLTTWTVEALSEELANDLPCFYVLTNSRAFPVEEAVRINREVGRNLTTASMRQPGRRDFVVISRSDSTLRGHFPAEVDALGVALSFGGGSSPRSGLPLAAGPPAARDETSTKRPAPPAVAASSRFAVPSQLARRNSASSRAATMPAT